MLIATLITLAAVLVGGSFGLACLADMEQATGRETRILRTFRRALYVD